MIARVELPPPDERVPPSTSGRIALSAMLAVLVVVLANAAAGAALSRYTPNRFDRQLATKWRMLDHLAAPVDGLILGDSTGNQGVDPAALGSVAGGRWLNLCTVADMLIVSDAWMLDTYIQKHGTPKAVVLVHAADVWPRQPDPRPFSRLPRPWGYWRDMQPPLSFDGEQLWLAALTRYVPLYTATESLREMLVFPWRLPSTWAKFRDDGFMPYGVSKPAQVKRQAAKHIRELTEDGFGVAEVNRQALARVAALAEQHGFDVYWAPGSVTDLLLREPVYRDYFDQAQRTVDEVTAGSPRFHRLYDGPQGFPVEVMMDMEHLTPAGAEHYGQRIGERLLELRGGQRIAGEAKP